MKRHLYIRFVMLGLLLGVAVSSAAQESAATGASGEAVLHFRRSSVKLEPGYAGNPQSLATLVSELSDALADNSRPLLSVDFIGSSSPEGDTERNNHYAEERISSVESYLRERVSIPDSLVTRRTIGANWAVLADSVQRSDIEEKQQVLDLITNYPELVFDDSGRLIDSRRKQLMDICGGRVWHYMEDHWFDDMRCVYVRVVRDEQRVEAEEVRIERVPLAMPVPEPLDSIRPYLVTNKPVAPAETAIPASAETPVKAESAGKPFYMSVQTNMLYDALLLPTIGAEFYLGSGWSIAGNWTYGWWDPGDRETYWRGYGGYLAVRRYFGKAAKNKPLTGHHVGVYGQILTYDIAYQGRGRMGGEPGKSILYNPSYAAGVEYGYALPISSRLNIDFTLGIGYLGGKYYSYRPTDGHYKWTGTNRLNWFGPTNLQVSLVWLIGRGNTNARH